MPRSIATVYVSHNYTIFQMDTTDTNSNNAILIYGLETSIENFPLYNTMAYAFDDKLYIGNWNDIVECLINGDVDIEMYTLIRQNVLSQTGKRVGLMAVVDVRGIVPSGVYDESGRMGEEVGHRVMCF